MSLKKSEVILLRAYNWSESSRTVVFFSKEYGKIAVNDKGGRTLKSKRGRLLPFSRLELTFYDSNKEGQGYVRDLELIQYNSMEKDGTIGRLAYASAACEVLKLLLPEEEPQRALYDYFGTYLEYIDKSEKTSLPSLFTTFYFRMLSQLGYHPSLNYCVGCNENMNGDKKTTQKILFSPEKGGVVCNSCQKPGDYYIGLSSHLFKLMLVFQAASLHDSVAIPISLKEAETILETLTSFVGYQTGLKSELKSLGFIEKLKNSHS